MPRPSYFNMLIWDQVLSRCRLFFYVEEDWDIKDFLVREAGLSPSTATGIVVGDQVTLTPCEVSSLSYLLYFPEALMEALIRRRPGEEILEVIKWLDACEDYERKADEDIVWYRTPRREESITAHLNICWGLSYLDAESPYEDILAFAYEMLCWTLVDDDDDDAWGDGGDGDPGGSEVEGRLSTMSTQELLDGLSPDGDSCVSSDEDIFLEPRAGQGGVWECVLPAIILEFSEEQALGAAWALSDHLTETEGAGCFSLRCERDEGTDCARVLVHFRSYPSDDGMWERVQLAIALPGFGRALFRLGEHDWYEALRPDGGAPPAAGRG